MSSRTVVEGYHGTTSDKADRILQHGFEASTNPYDWLGDGIYFFQDGASRAREFARSDYDYPQRDEIAVLRSTLRLRPGRCIDLLDTVWNDALREVYRLFVEKYGQVDTLTQNRGRRELDRTVLNLACGTVLPDRGIHVDAVRASFREGKPIYPRSRIYGLSHVQIAVRNQDIIEGTELVSFPTES